MSAQRIAYVGVFAAISLNAQYSYYLPQVSDGNTGSGSLRTTLVVANVMKAVANVKVSVTRDDGSVVPLTFSGLGSGTSFTTRLAAGATRLWISDGRGDGSPAAAVITSDTPLRVSAIVSSVNGSGEVIGESTARSLSNEEIGTEYLAAADTTAGADSGMALYNPGAGVARMTVRLLDAAGGEAGSTEVTLRAGGRTTFPTSRLAGPDSNFRGTLAVASSARIAAVAVRQTASSPAYSLLPALDRQSRGLHFFAPYVEDGRSDTGTRQTTFLLTNLSKQEASVQMSVALSDGSTYTPAIGSVSSDGTVQSTISPGATVVWQTDGSREGLASGTAVIKSDHPIGVSATITSLDAGGAFVSESGAALSARNFQFLIPFENSRGVSSGATFFNTSAIEDLTMTVDLLDPEGKVLGSRQFGPVSKGTGASALVTELFPAAPASGAIRVSTGPLQPFLSVAGVRQLGSGQRLSGGPVILPWVATGTPTTVRPTLDAARKATAAVGAAGGTLRVTDSKGNRFTLTIPPQALPSQQTITMTAITSATGFSGPGFVAGVQLEPDGLVLYVPALLKIEMAGATPDNVSAVGWRGDRPGIYLNPPLPGTDSLTLFLSHFSGAGVGGMNVTVELQSLAGILELSAATIAHYLGQARQLSLLGLEDESLAKRAEAVAVSEQAYESAIKPLMELALKTLDTDLMYCALVQSLQFEQSRQFAGISNVGNGPDPIGDEIRQFRILIYDLRLQLLINRCKSHDFTAYFDLLGAGRQEIFFGGTTFPDSQVLIDTLKECTPRVELDYIWRMTLKSMVLAGGLLEYDGRLEGNMVLTGSFTKDALTGITDPLKDLETSFVLDGSYIETYKTPKLTDSTVLPVCGQVGVKNLTVQPAIMKVAPNFGKDQHSEVKFRFDPHYDPAATTLGGEQLCSFCPVFRKTPVSVQLMLDPGVPKEKFDYTCGSQTIPSSNELWHAAWQGYYKFGVDYLSNWTIANTPDLVARKTVSRSQQPGPTISTSEEAVFELKACTGLIEPSPLGQKCTK